MDIERAVGANCVSHKTATAEARRNLSDRAALLISGNDKRAAADPTDQGDDGDNRRARIAS